MSSLTPALVVLALLACHLPGASGAGPVAEPQGAAEVFESGRKLLRGEGMPKDTKRALELIREAAEAGHADAMNAMGYFYLNGVEVPKDPAKAADWVRRGAEAGSAKAQLSYGNLLVEGKGGAKDEATGLEWIRKAAAAGLPEAQNRLGMAYLAGRSLPGVEKDRSKAYEMFQPAAEAGLAAAQHALGHIHDQRGDFEAAEMWYRRAAKQGFAQAQANLGRSILGGAAPSDRDHRVEGLQWLFLAQEAGEPTANNTLDQIMAAYSAAEIAEARERAEAFQAAPTGQP
jgi:TPR repeat protein